MKQSISSKFIIIVSGPTGVGKTDFVVSLADHFPLEIINADVGQLYTPLTIGTAKPDWKHEKVPHHLFDVINEPQSLTVMHYRNMVLPLLEQCWQRNSIPVIVGGSLFYIKSLLFPPFTVEPERDATKGLISHVTDDLWRRLYEIDPDRARALHKNDSYRIQRALSLWSETGIKPSQQKPIYDPIASYLFLYCTRQRTDLYGRINQRVSHMIDAGWIEETKALVGTPWEDFLLSKKIIGYDDIVRYLLHHAHDRDALIEIIAQKTRNYAKRQETFWRGLEKNLREYLSPQALTLPKIDTLDLTLLDHDLYIKQLSFLLTNLK